MIEHTSPTSETTQHTLQLTVIGDVGVDWGFISNEPSRPRAPAFQPWAHYPSTHLFAFPGGAWFSGHMIQGAFASPPFRHTYSAEVDLTATSNYPPTIALTGKLACYGYDDQSVTIHLSLLKDEDNTPILKTILLNDSDDIPTKDISRLTITIGSDALNSGLLSLGLLRAHIDCEPYDSRRPGHIEPDTIYRCLRLTNARLSGDASSGTLDCNRLAIHAKAFEVAIEYSDGRQTVTHKPLTALSLLTDATRRGDTCGNAIARITLPSDRGNVIYLKEAAIDVLYGRLTVNHTVVDAGKINPVPMPLEACSKGPLTIQTLDYDDTFYSRSVPIKFRLWLYQHPGALLYMQRPGHVVHTLSELARYPQSSSDGRAAQVYRLAKRHGIDGPEHGYPTILNHHYPQPDPSWHSVHGPRVIVIDDDGTGFCSRHECWLPYFLDAASDRMPSTSKDLSDLIDGTLPKTLVDSLRKTWVVIKASHWLNPGHNQLIDFLQSADMTERTILIVSAESLRTGLIKAADRPGIKLAKTVSWERTLEDFQAALTQAKLGQLLACNNMIVRVGLEGALHFQRAPYGTALPQDQAGGATRVDGSTVLYFDPELIEGEYTSAEKFGELPGLTTVFVAAFVRELAGHIAVEYTDDSERTKSFTRALKDGILFGLQSGRRFYDLGYGPTPETVRKYERLQLPITQVFGRAPLAIGRSGAGNKLQAFRIDDKQSPGDWSILNRQLKTSDPAMSKTSAKPGGLVEQQEVAVCCARNALRLGRTIVLRGAGYAFDKCPFKFPFARFGDLLAVDRHEIEGLRSIRNLLEEYIGHPERKIPLSIAVFGPPGSGKSFGVQQIARVVAGSRRIRESLFNLAQFEDFGEVSRVLLQVRDAALDDELPLVFFDEFDSPLKRQPLGWLKYFLAPMHDGRFQHGQSMLGIGKAIFVFAGGIASRHEDFKSEDFWKGGADPSRTGGNLFLSAKGPDFHSRLRGFLNIVGPNPKHTSPASRRKRVTSASDEDREDPYLSEDFAYIVRRAIAIRQMIERLARESEAALLDVEGRADIDKDVLDALLLTEEYMHGVRSLHAILEMSALHKERSISKTVIPATEQVGMHVDETFRYINRREYTKLKSMVLQRLYDGSFPSVADTFEDR